MSESPPLSKPIIEAALKETRGNVRRAAEVLAVNERTLWRRIGFFGIFPNEFSATGATRATHATRATQSSTESYPTGEAVPRLLRMVTDDAEDLKRITRPNRAPYMSNEIAAVFRRAALELSAKVGREVDPWKLHDRFCKEAFEPWWADFLTRLSIPEAD